MCCKSSWIGNGRLNQPRKVLQHGDKIHGHDSISNKERIIEKGIFCKWHTIAIWRKKLESRRFTVTQGIGKKDVQSITFSAVWQGKGRCRGKIKYSQTGGTRRWSLSLCGNKCIPMWVKYAKATVLHRKDSTQLSPPRTRSYFPV